MKWLPFFFLTLTCLFIVSCDDDDALQVPDPEARFSATVNDTSGIVSFLNLSSEAESYVWDFGDGDSSTIVNPTHTYADSGTYTVTLAAANEVDVIDIFQDEITITVGGDGSGGGGGDGDVPTEPAPTPTQAEADVISIFSDAYTDVPVDAYLTSWSAAGLEPFDIGGDNIHQYTNVDFAGIETVTTTVDATNMTHFHMDVWSGDFENFAITIVDFGADGAFDGGDDVQQRIEFDMPATGEWISYDLALADMTDLTTRMNIAQYIISAQPSGEPTVFVDNIYFYNENGSGGGGDVPTVSAPTPTQAEADVISIYSDAYTDVIVDTYLTPWSAAMREPFAIGSDSILQYTQVDFAGIETVANQLDINGMTHFHMDVWSPDYEFFAFVVVDFGPDGAFGGGDDVQHRVEFEMPATSQWVSLDVPLSDFVDLTTRSNIAQFIINARPTGATTVFVDNIYFYNENGSGGGGDVPTVSAPMPTQAEADVISIYSDAYTDVFVDTYLTPWSAAMREPFAIGSDSILQYTQVDFAGIETVANQLDINGMTHFHMDVWSADYEFFAFVVVDFGPDGAFGGGDDVQHRVEFEMPATSQWVSLDVPLSDFVDLTTRSNIAQFIINARPTGATTVFIDNIYFYDENGGGGGMLTEPDMPAPTPTQAASDVISIYSDAYTDVPVDAYLTSWSSAGLEAFDIAGDNIHQYTDVDFAGIETVSTTVDASEMTHFHLDVWSADYDFFAVTIVDFGADGVFGGGDDVQERIEFEMPATEQWISYDLALADMANLTTRANVAQYIISARPTGAPTVFVDNIYFYDDGSGGGGMLTEPDVPAPTPTQAASDVISIYSDAYTDVPVDAYLTPWSSAGLEAFDIAGDNIHQYTNVDFAGIETVSTTVDATEMTHFHLDVWSADYDFFAVTIVDFGADGAFGGGDDVQERIEFEMPATEQWISYDLALADMANLTTRANVAQYIISARPVGTPTVFVDNIYFYDDGSGGGGMLTEPDVPAPTPAQAASDVISIYSDAYTDVPVDAYLTSWSSAGLEAFDIAGDNIHQYTNVDFAGIETVSTTVDATEMTHFHLDVWSADYDFFAVTIVDFGADGAFGGGDDVQERIEFEMPATEQWISYDLALADMANLTTRANVAQYIISARPVGAPTVFVDNIYFYDDGSGGGGMLTEPDVPAQMPTIPEADVLSVYSDAYTDVIVDTYLTSWSSAGLEAFDVAGDNIHHYTNVDFAGIETVANQLDITDMTHFRMDVWSADFDFFAFVVVDFGPDGAFGGGDDVQHRVEFDLPATGQWLTLDVPLSDFTDLTTRANIAQIIINARPTGTSNVFVDNIMFYRQ